MHKIIELTEQKGYGKPERYSEKLEACSNLHNEITVPRGRGNCPCLTYTIKGEELSYQTSYFIGLDWIVENKIAAYVKPKMDNDIDQINYISMLMYALNNIDNHKHLTDLIHINFERPHIEIEETNDELSLFIIIEYLCLLRNLVQGGLKRDYYIVDENLNSRIKGKILIGQDVKTNRVKGTPTNTFCRYQYYGYDNEENRILKKAFMFACKAIERRHMENDASLSSIINYIKPAFKGVKDAIEISRIKKYKPNPLYPEYRDCLRLALMLLRRYSYNIKPTYRGGKHIVATPPYWIDMSKLFELYVYQKLNENFPRARGIQYHEHINYQELDILFNNDNHTKYVIDTKYKPRYEDGRLSMYDIRQVCGYARMSKVYEILEFNRDQIIPALIIYPSMQGNDLIPETLEQKIEPDDRYINVYKLGIKLPTIKIGDN